MIPEDATRIVEAVGVLGFLYKALLPRLNTWFDQQTALTNAMRDWMGTMLHDVGDVKRTLDRIEAQQLAERVSRRPRAAQKRDDT